MVEKAQNSVKIAPGGDVTTGPRTVIHPKAWIVAEAAPMIGECNIIEEQTIIINGYPENINHRVGRDHKGHRVQPPAKQETPSEHS
uniref:Dynactin subunit 6 n=1 Tax=Podarcis muralis TaxID=64176 RepID=A0A670JRQ4_PODMU